MDSTERRYSSPQTTNMQNTNQASQLTHASLEELENWTTMDLDLMVRKFTSTSDCHQWARYVMTEESLDPIEISDETSSTPIEEAERRFIAFFLKLARTLFELARVPIFREITLASMVLKDRQRRIFTLKLRCTWIDFIPLDIYNSIFDITVRACDWMAENSPRSDHQEKILSSIHRQVFERLREQVPGGDSTIPVLKTAHQLGIPFMHLGLGAYQIGWGSQARRLDRSATELDSAIGAKLSHNKVTAGNLLRLAGLPAPVHVVVDEPASALAAAERLGFPVVVKPVDGDRGEGVTVDISDADELRTSVAHALQFSVAKKVIVERQVAGVCHRLFVANGGLLYAVKRWPIAVRGDGKRSVNDLVNEALKEQKRLPPWTRSRLRPLDERARAALAHEGLSPNTIPPMGSLAPLRRIESTADGGVDEEVTANVHPANLSAALIATKLFGLHVAGIDIISPDIARPWYENGAIINEVNFAPLFGGGDVSRSYIASFLTEFLNGDGRIPVERHDSEEAALAQQLLHHRQGRRCYFTTPTRTLDSCGKLVSMPFRKLNQRLKALVYRFDVDAIVYCLGD